MLNANNKAMNKIVLIMKKSIFKIMAVLLPMLLVQSCTNPALDELRRRLDDHESRLSKVEQHTTVANQEIVALKELLAAQAKQKNVVDYRPLDDGTGYLLSFSDGSELKLLHGKNGISSDIGVKLDKTDNTYYWTVNGEWMYDPNGKKIKAQGVDGVSGVTPILRVSNKGYWEYSLDGKSWHLIQTADGAPVKATSNAEDSGLDIQETETHVIIYFKGQRFMIPKSGSGAVTPPSVEVKISLSEQTHALVVGESFTLTAKLEPTVLDPSKIIWESSEPSIAKVENGVVTALTAGDVVITATHSGVSAKCMVSVTEPVKNLTFQFKVHDIRAINALFDVTPSEDDMTYYTAVTEKELWDSKGPEGVFESDKMYFGSQGGDWTQSLSIFLVKGAKKDLPTKEVGQTNLKPNTEYVFYAYGLNLDGQRTSEIASTTFKTPEQKKKGLTFKIDVEDVLTNGIIASITPSNNDLQYVVAIVRDNYGKFYSKRDDLKEVGAWKLIGEQTIFTKGKYIISPESVDAPKYEKMLPGFNYWIVLFGFDDDGITSEVIYHKFTTKKRS